MQFRALYQPKDFSGLPPFGAHDEILARLALLDASRNGLPEFIKLFLSDGLLPDLVYALGLKMYKYAY
ncbi:hypothetical protein A3I48_04195 [Candidatus Daviesbacteria bacterium RIFCSPLOWO2_02_FULL_36_7]|uniref:Uncharacterized protein n=1 Tax=Candidatus Daviesbacteria bacterium RIFCSPLOWO2_02_FULL_36_7 TaxID=1797792 RepID=A0A1F5MHT5_9BACT|nr:MAG: hypothetical protein A3I48_04195 [Candidatus Daviesbacteria bacterium RIFCSPLOWO2_02_FULL_36_7]